MNYANFSKFLRPNTNERCLLMQITDKWLCRTEFCLENNMLIKKYFDEL